MAAVPAIKLVVLSCSFLETLTTSMNSSVFISVKCIPAVTRLAVST